MIFWSIILNIYVKIKYTLYFIFVAQLHSINMICVSIELLSVGKYAVALWLVTGAQSVIYTLCTVCFTSFLLSTELQVEMIPDRVVERDDVTLTCKTSCRLTPTPTFTWYRNGVPLSSSSNPLRLPSVRQSDAGVYSCAVEERGYRSPAVTLNVQCKYRMINSLNTALKVHASSLFLNPLV